MFVGFGDLLAGVFGFGILVSCVFVMWLGFVVVGWMHV